MLSWCLEMQRCARHVPVLKVGWAVGVAAVLSEAKPQVLYLKNLIVQPEGSRTRSCLRSWCLGEDANAQDFPHFFRLLSVLSY